MNTLRAWFARVLAMTALAAVSVPAVGRTDFDLLAKGLSHQNIEKLKAATCTACHDLTKRIVGPSWQEVAARHAGDGNAPRMLAERVTQGGKGNWGNVPMPPNPKISLADAEDLVRALLAVNVAQAGPSGAPVAAGRQQRVALVVGNGAYRAAPLKTAINDSVAMEKVLAGLGFEVVRVNDMKAVDIRPALGGFLAKLSPDAIALFYFSGHGARVDFEDYMFAVDAGAGGPIDLGRDAISLDRLLQGLEARKARANIVILDTDRTNPFETGSGARSPERPGPAVLPPQNTLVAFGTGTGGVAGDSTDGRNGRFTAHLIKALGTQDQSIDMVLKLVKSAVKAESKGQQEPWWTSSIGDDIVLARATDAPSGGMPQESAATAAARAQTTLNEITARANGGDVSAMKLLAKVYLDGADGIDKNILEAHSWLIKARLQNDPEAYYLLGRLYESGRTVDGEINLRAAQGSYFRAAELGHSEARRSYERLAALSQPARAQGGESAGSSSISFGDFLRGVGKVIGAAGMVAGARYNDPGMMQQGAALIGGDANEIARAQAAQNARQQAARQAQSGGGAGGGDCAQFARNRDIARAEAQRSLNDRRVYDQQSQVAQINDNAYRACISQ